MSIQKSKKDYLSIKEFSGLVGLPVSTLRHYDKTGVFAPVGRGEENKGKYRYYSPAQITKIKMIRVLSEIGLPLKMIRELSRSRTPETMLKVLSRQKSVVADEERLLKEAQSVIDAFIELLTEGISATETEITAALMPEKPIILGDLNVFSGADGFYEEYTRFCSAPHGPKLGLSYPVGGYFESMAAFLQAPTRPTRFFSLDPKGHEAKKAGLYLIGYTRGCYGEVNGLPKQMASFAKKHGFVFTGPVYNIYLTDEVSVMAPEEYLLQISVPISETWRSPPRRPRLSLQH